jgi:DNA-directed RNA polymerase
VDVLYQAPGESFHFHVDLALRTGASVEQIRSVLHFLEEWSLPKVWQAFEALNRLLETVTGRGVLVLRVFRTQSMRRIPGAEDRRATSALRNLAYKR